MLATCHGRIEHQCETLRRLAAHLPVHSADAQARDTARAVMRYFDTAARDHHADDEHDLFPALLESMAGSDATCIRDLTTSLCAEHQHLEQLWRAVRGALDRVAAGDACTLDATRVEALIDAYQRHIAREDAELLPMARACSAMPRFRTLVARCASAATSTGCRSHLRDKAHADGAPANALLSSPHHTGDAT